MLQRVFITGIGIISPIGIGKDEFWKNLLEGKSGIRPFPPLEEMPVQARKAGYVFEFNPKELITGINSRRLSRYTQFTLAAVILALKDSGLDIDSVEPHRKGFIFNTIRGSYKTTVNFLRKLYTSGPSMVSPLKFSQTVMNAAATPVHLKYGIKGVSTVLTGSSAINMGYNYLKNDKAEVIICGGVDVISFLDPFKTLEDNGMLAHRENGVDEQSRPADARRNGFVYSEAAAFVVLENEKSVQSRGGTPYAEVIGYGAAHDGKAVKIFNHRTAEPIRYAMETALRKSGIMADQVGFISGMANSSVGIDDVEAEAIKQLFNSHSDYAITSYKGSVGETFGASESLGVVQAALALKEQFIPPTANLEMKDINCDLPYVTGKPVHVPLEYAIANSFEAGGNVQSTVLHKV